MGGVGLLDRIFNMGLYQLVDSDLPSTRVYWRKDVWGFPDEIANDPRPMREVLGSWPDWRTGRVEAKAEAAS